MSDTKLKTSNIGDLAITHDKLHTTMDLTGKTVTVATPTADTHPATKVYVDTEVANLIDSAPGTLDTLNELAAAINDDANFNATIATSLSEKLPLAGGTMTGVLKIPDGSSSAPSIAFGDDTNTGIYSSSNDAISLATGGSARFSVNSLGTYSSYNVSSGNSGAFRNYGGTWQAKAELTGNGFTFINSVDGTAATISSTGNAVFTGTATATSFIGSGAALTGIDALPSQTGHAGKYLTTDATTATWAVLDTDSNTTTKALYEMSNVIAADYTIASGNNAFTAGPITINTGISITVPSGSTWVIA